MAKYNSLTIIIDSCAIEAWIIFSHLGDRNLDFFIGANF